MPPLLMPQPPIAPLVPPAHVVDLMTLEGSAAFGARWKAMEAKIVECPALSDAMPEFRTTYDIDPHAELQRLRRFRMAGGCRDRTGCQAGRRHGVVLLVPRDPDDTGTRAMGFATAGAKAVLTVNVDDYAEVWVNGVMPRAAGRPSPAAIQGFNMPNRVVLRDTVTPGEKFEIAVFAINGPISAAPANFLWFREAKIEFYR